MPILISSKDYQQITAQNSMPVVIEFYATWCSKCMMMEAIYNRVATKLKDYFNFYKIDVDTAATLIKELGIEIYPTFIVYQKGNIIGYTSGVLSELTLHERLLEMVSSPKKR